MDLAAANSQKNPLTVDIFEEHLHKAIDKQTVNYRMTRVGPSLNGRGSKLKIHSGLIELLGLKRPLIVV